MNEACARVLYFKDLDSGSGPRMKLCGTYMLNSFRLEVWGDKMKSEHKQAAVYANIWVTTSKHADRFYLI